MTRARWLVVVAALSSALLACGDQDGVGGGDLATRGRALYEGEATCATCHGADLRGTTMGPPFLHEVYAPDHHPDDAFRRAVRDGVQPHHWDFGPMPPLPHLGDDEVDAIVAYVRAQQRAAGITTDETSAP